MRAYTGQQFGIDAFPFLFLSSSLLHDDDDDDDDDDDGQASNFGPTTAADGCC
jgi:hypothetical protein